MYSRRRYSILPSKVEISEDKQEARKEYIRLRQCVRETFESFLRNLNLKSLHALEVQFELNGGELNSCNFLRVFEKVFPAPVIEKPGWTASYDERRFIQQTACLTLFEFVDVDQSGGASWMEFVEFVCAIAEELRMQAAEESGQTFEFHLAEQIALPFRPVISKCHFDRIFCWPDHPLEPVVVMEEGQSGFYLHRPKTLSRKKRVEGHQHDLLSATFLPAPFNCTATSGNDNLVCFWDENFNLVKKWTLDQTWTGEKGKVTSAGVLCWCHEIGALYAADHFSEHVRAWRIKDMMQIKASEGVLEPDKRLSLMKHSTHTKAVQAICWMGPLKTLATASLDTTVQVFDLVQMKRTFVLSGHKRGLTCLQYCPKNHMLLSAGFDNYINIWDPGAGTLCFALEGHECSIAGICSIPDTDFEFMSVDFESQVRLWDVRRLVCLQNFCATDRQLEKNGELEPLEPRTICALNRDRVVISGRRMVVFDREASNPQVTADWPINAIVFNERRLEIVTPIKNDLYVWCALTGTLRTVHDNIVDGTITAITLGRGERRIFVGADDGEIVVVNYACGALLKKFEPHECEVTQITCIPEKVLTLSVPEKLIKVHDDTDPQRAPVLKRIDVSDAGIITQFAYDGRDIIAGTSEDCQIVWYNMAFSKQVSSSESCEVMHKQPVSCCVYFEDAPLLATADAEGSVIFWSVPPLRTYNFFNKLNIQFGEDKPYSICAMALSWPDEEFIYCGVERGHLACVCIRSIVENARSLRKDILRRKDAGEAAEVISGRIFESMPKPCDSPEYVFTLPNVWMQSMAHRGSIEKIVVCKRKMPVVISLGSDACVRIWSHTTGEALGTLEQGLPVGLSWERGPWHFPMDAHEELVADQKFIEFAALLPQVVDDDDDDKSSLSSSSASATSSVRGRDGVSAASRRGSAELRRGSAERQSSPKKGGKEPAQEQPVPRLTTSHSAPTLRAGSKGPAGGSPSKRRTSAAGVDFGGYPSKLDGVSKAQTLPKRKGMKADDEWYAGPYSSGFWAGKSLSTSSSMGLPKLPSGLARPKLSSNKDLVAAARRLSGALGEIEVTDRRSKKYF